MNLNSVLLFLAQKGYFKRIRQSAFRKFRRRNVGLDAIVKCHEGFSIKTIIGDSVDNKIYVFKSFEDGVTRVIERLSSHCHSFVDVGCNIGYFSCLFGYRNPGKPLYCIDPNPVMIERTAENLKLNNITAGNLLNIGIGSESRVLSLNIPINRHSLSSFAYAPDKGGLIKQVEAQVLPLHDVFEQYSIQDTFIKIDTEGFEREVFLGFNDIVLENTRFILFEMSAANLRRAGYSPKDVFDLKLMENFEVFIVKGNKEGSLLRINPADIVDNPDLNVNVLLARKDEETKKIMTMENLVIHS